MHSVSKMQTVKGKSVGEESVIGELVRYDRVYDNFARRARIALLEADSYDFDTLFEISQEFMGFVRLGDYDSNMAEMAEELRVVGIFCDDEKKIDDAVNEMVIIIPKKNRAILAPDIKALTSFENTLSSNEKKEEELTFCGCGFLGQYKKDLNKIKKYFQNT